MPRVANIKGADPRMPMLERKVTRLLDRLDKLGDLLQTAQSRMDQAEQVMERLRQRVSVVENKLP